jgi:hypothetical protein
MANRAGIWTTTTVLDRVRIAIFPKITDAPLQSMIVSFYSLRKDNKPDLCRQSDGCNLTTFGADAQQRARFVRDHSPPIDFAQPANLARG